MLVRLVVGGLFFGHEYPLVLLAALFSLAESGPGQWSLGTNRRPRHGTLQAILARRGCGRVVAGDRAGSP